MSSRNISGSRRATDTAQMTLSFEPGLGDLYPSLRECIATGIYRRGLTKVAPHLDCAPSNLSNALAGAEKRKLGVDEFEKYITEFKDFTPIYYLVDKYLSEAKPIGDAATDEFRALLPLVLAAAKKAGLA